MDQAPDSANTPITDSVGETLRAGQRLVSHLAELAALETAVAGRAVVSMFGCMAGVVLCLTAAWLALWVMIGLWLAATPLGWTGALLLICLVNLALAAALVVAIFSFSRNLTFRATRRAMSWEPG